MTDQAPQYALNETLTRAFYKAGSAGGAVLDKKIKIYVAEEMKRIPIAYPPQLLRPVYINSQQTTERSPEVAQSNEVLQIKQQQGMDRKTGKVISDLAHLQQSIEDILSTRLSTRVMRRHYGSDIPNLIDAPTNQLTLIHIFVATAKALKKWEPRFKLKRVNQQTTTMSGKSSIYLEGEYLGRYVSLEVSL